MKKLLLLAVLVFGSMSPVHAQFKTKATLPSKQQTRTSPSKTTETDNSTIAVTGVTFRATEVKDRTDAIVKINILPHPENIWLLVVVTQKSDGWEMRHFGPIGATTDHIEDLWPLMSPDTYTVHATLQRLKTGTTDVVTDYESNTLVFTVGKGRDAQ